MRNVFIVLVLFMSINLIWGETFSIEKVFQNANDLYQKGNYIEANNLYESIVASNIKSSIVFYNLASSYAMLEKKGNAILWYERALRLSPFDKDINTALENINGVKSPIPYMVILTYIFTFLFLASFTSFIIFLFYKKRKKILLSLFVFTIVVFLSLFFIQRSFNGVYMIVLENDVNLYKGGSTKSEVITFLREGNKLKVLEEYNDWYYVKTSINKKGWVKKDFLVKI